MSGVINMVLFVAVAAVIVVLTFVIANRYMDNPDSMLVFSIDEPVRGMVVDIAETLPLSHRPYVQHGCGDGETPGWYYPVVQYTYNGIEYKEVCLNGTKNRNKLKVGKKMVFFVCRKNPRFFIVSSKQL